jgi:poly(A) polymerase/tRNA nucleotidyltransferase (CCA-adding enzyme)
MNIRDKNLYYIGGVVRDEILGKESFDVDLTYVGDAIEFAKNLPEVEIVRINEPFGTVKIKFESEEIDIASTRSESYPQKGHLPVVQKTGCSLKEDILRRDFTVNALAKSTLTGEIIDYTGGLKDISAKVLRVLHDKSFIDDPTRIIRGLKFSVRFGFELEEHTKKLQEDYLADINYDMSKKRIKKELEETFNLNSQEAFNRFINQKIYKLVTPKNFDLPNTNFESLIKKYGVENVWIIYAGQLPDIETLPLTKVEQKIVDEYRQLKEKRYDSDFEIYKNFEGVNPESVIMYAGVDYNAVVKYFDNLRKISVSVNGEDLKALGISPGADYQKCFDYILARKISNPNMVKEDEVMLAREFFGL